MRHVSIGGPTLAALCVIVITILIATLVYMYWVDQSKGSLTCPGLKPTHAQYGNLSELTKFGGLHEFFCKNHNRLGDIFSFWWCEQMCVSVGSPALWKDVTTLFDRPVEQFKLFEALIGKKSIQYLNGDEGKKHRKILDRYFTKQNIVNWEHVVTRTCTELSTKWRSLATSQAHSEGEHIPLQRHMFALAIKMSLGMLFGSDYFKTNKEILQFEESYHTCWDEMYSRLEGEIPTEGSDAELEFSRARDHMRRTLKSIIDHRKTADQAGNPCIIIDELVEQDSFYENDENLVDNLQTFIIGAFHTTGNLLTWIFIYLAEHQDIVNRVRDEIRNKIPDGGEMTVENVEKLAYIRQVIDESLRLSALAPYAARSSEYDIIIGGHLIPKHTPIFLPLGRVLKDATVWPEPEKFNPDRFTAEACRQRHPMAFQPFGFAGKRKCPGYRLAYYDTAAVIATVCREFDVHLVPGQTIEPEYRLVSQPKEDVFVTVMKL